MSVPRSVTKVTKNGIEFTSNVDRVNYTMKELCRAALRDVGKLVCKRFRQSYYARFKRRRGRIGKYTQYWVRHKQEEYPNMQVGVKPNAFYGGFQEFGSSKTPRLGLLSSAVQDNLSDIIRIESQYLSALEDEARALSLVSEEEYEGGGED